MVVLLIGILTTVAVTKISTQLQGHSVDSAAALLRTDIETAQQEAIATSTTATVTVNRLTHSYTVTASRNGKATVIRSVNLISDPWKCSISTLLSGSTWKPVDVASLSINGAGVFGSDLEVGLASGSATATVRVEANSKPKFAE